MAENNIIDLDLGMNLDDTELDSLQIIRPEKSKTLAEDLNISEEAPQPPPKEKVKQPEKNQPESNSKPEANMRDSLKKFIENPGEYSETIKENLVFFGKLSGITILFFTSLYWLYQWYYAMKNDPGMMNLVSLSLLPVCTFGSIYIYFLLMKRILRSQSIEFRHKDRSQMLRDIMTTFNPAEFVSSDLNSFHALQNMGSRFLSALTSQMHLKGAFIFTLKGEEVDIIITSGAEVRKRDFTLKRGILKHLVQSRKFRICNQYYKEYSINPSNKLPWEENHLIGVPFYSGSKIIGGMVCSGKIDNRSFSNYEVDLIRTLSNYMLVILQSYSIAQDKVSSEVRRNKEIRKFQALYGLSRAITFIENLNLLLCRILDKAIELCEAEKGSLMLLNKSDELEVKVVRGIDPKISDKILRGEIKCAKFKIGEGVAGSVLQNGEGIIVNSGRKSVEFTQKDKSTNVDSIMCTPLISSDEKLGVINITNKKIFKDFDNYDLELLTALAGLAASAIKNATLYEMAVTDLMTKLYSHRFFQNSMDKELIRSRRYKSQFSLVFTDVDHFKGFNDTYGHQTGDLVLIEVAKIMKHQARDTDLPCRYGGEEFCVILPETDEDGAEIFAERLRKAIEEAELEDESGFKHKITVSIGVSTFPEDGDTKELLIKHADNALYCSKENGRNQCTSWRDVKDLKFNE